MVVPPTSTKCGPRSASKDEATHGRKLYFLFAKDRKAYVDPAKAGNPAGQVLVKESWSPKEVAADTKPEEKRDPPQPLDSEPETLDDELRALGGSYIPYASKDGKHYHADKKGELFLMLKYATDTPGTDEGWVYGTTTSDGKTVTSAGLVASCMKCHEDAPHDRVFGLQPVVAAGGSVQD